MAIPQNDHSDSSDHTGGRSRSRRGPFRNLNPYVAPTIQETQAEGTQLFMRFLQDRYQDEGIELSTNFNENASEELLEASGETFDARAVFDEGPQPEWNVAGNNLKRLADEFARSKGRQEVRDQAAKLVELDLPDYDSFQEFLTTYFEDGRNPTERIVTLFFFLSDLIIQSIKRKVGDLAKKLFKWSIHYIILKFCKWVYDLGGWNSILGSVYSGVIKVVASVATIVIAIAILTAIWKTTVTK